MGELDPRRVQRPASAKHTSLRELTRGPAPRPQLPLPLGDAPETISRPGCCLLVGDDRGAQQGHEP